MITEEIQTSEQLSYVRKRMDELGMSQEDNQIKVLEENGQHRSIEIFTADPKTDDIRIAYVGLDRRREMRQAGKKEVPYIVRRLKVPKEGQAKYLTPKGAPTRPFFPPPIIGKVEKEEKIKTLIITEGQFKAFKGGMHGLDVVGVQGIHNIKNQTKEKLNEDLGTIITRCQVENVVFLLDADVYEISFDPEKKDKDLSKRLSSFCTAVNHFKELIKAFEVESYFAHIHLDYLDRGKGLDDLLVLEHGREVEVVKDLLLLTSHPQKWFKTIQLSGLSRKKLNEYFFLDSVTRFYAQYQELIGDSPFRWNGGWFQQNEEGKVNRILPFTSDEVPYIRVGVDYFKRTHRLTADKKLETLLKPWRAEAIREDYVKTKKIPDIFEMIKRYDCFTNVPDHGDSYQEGIELGPARNYNLYHKLSHEMESGEWPKTEVFLKHIFGEQYTYGLDYLTILFQQPKEKLPILCLVSEERKTGKSTFLFWLRELFGANAIIISSNDFNDSFNTSYASKLIIAIDESFLDRRAVLERLKSMSTSSKIIMNGKGRQKQEIDFFAKFVMTSNNEDYFISIDEKEIRFWVRKVGTIELEDPELMRYMITEIPAFLHFLKNRDIEYEKKTRMWFDTEDLVTDALLKVKGESKSRLEKDINSMIREMMLDFGLETLEMAPKDISFLLAREGIRVELRSIREVLKKKFGMTPAKAKRYEFKYWEEINGENTAHSRKGTARVYIFNARDFLTQEELGYLTSPEAPF